MPSYWQLYMVLPSSTVVLEYGNVFHGDIQKSLGNIFQLKYCIFWWLSCLCLTKTWKMLIWTVCFVGSGGCGLEKTWYELSMSGAYWTYLFIKMSLTQGIANFPCLLQIRQLRQLAAIFRGRFFWSPEAKVFSTLLGILTDTISVW